MNTYVIPTKISRHCTVSTYLYSITFHFVHLNVQRDLPHPFFRSPPPNFPPYPMDVQKYKVKYNLNNPEIAKEYDRYTFKYLTKYLTLRVSGD